ncbi:hypothetical protein AURDEDRAFT_162173 [Auricularia subglabra TFB-10046 SS5]|nr:hypothetical protein AURDEDRAFT_162173 [Auricularia subglabra TFB-10046 SS5]
MASRLADETLHQILQIALEVADDDFADISGLKTSPFALRESSSSEILLVCKRWMRVATPLLYDTVIIRSTAQARALARALKKSPQFVRYLKKLRLEGGFGASVEKVMCAAVNLHDLHLSLDVGSQDNVKGMCDAMPAINPTRLVLSPRTGAGWTTSSEGALNRALRDSVPVWSNLTTLVIPHVGLGTIEFKALLPKFTSVLHVHVKSYRFSPRDALDSLFGFSPKAKVHILEADIAPHSKEFMKRYVLHLSRIVIHREENRKPTVGKNKIRKSGGLAIHRARDDVQREIWRLVLKHAIDTDAGKAYTDFRNYEFYTSELEFPGNFVTNKGSLRYMSVCKLFWDICLRLAARCPVLDGEKEVESFLSLLKRSPELAPDVRSLVLKTTFTGRSSPLFVRLPDVMSLQIRLNLSDVHFILYYGALEELCVEIRPQDRPSPSVLSCPTLRRLLITFSETELPPPQKPLDLILPQLEELVLPSPSPSWCLNVFPRTQLPQLVSLCVSYYHAQDTEDVLAAYGQNCEDVTTNASHFRLVLLHCPNVLTMTLMNSDLASASAALRSPDTRVYPELTQMIFTHLTNCMPPGIHSKKNEKKRTDEIGAFFAALSKDMFPALDEIVAESIQWPATPREIATDPAVKWAECLLEKGITLRGEDGKAWRPRLKSTSARKR